MQLTARLPMDDVAIPLHRFSVDDYYRMDAAGVFDADERIELLDGRIVTMARIGSRHASVVKKLNRLLTSAVGERAIVSVQDPLRLDDYSEPVPDVVVARPRADFYSERHPLPGDTFLVIEVSDSTLRLDRAVKLPLYARAGIPEVWIVDLQHGCLEVYLDPEGGQFKQMRRLGPTESAIPTGIEGIALSVGTLF